MGRHGGRGAGRARRVEEVFGRSAGRRGLRVGVVVRAARGVGLGIAGIKQNGIPGRLLRDSWLASAEHLA